MSNLQSKVEDFLKYNPIDWDEIPEQYSIPKRHTEALRRYVNDRLSPGHCLRAALKNDFMEFVNYADNETLSATKGLAIFVNSRLPPIIWGDKESVVNWAGSRY